MDGLVALFKLMIIIISPPYQENVCKIDLKISFIPFVVGVRRFSHLKDLIELYQENGDADHAYENLVSGNWAKAFLMGKPKTQITNFTEHVSVYCVVLYSLTRGDLISHRSKLKLFLILFVCNLPLKYIYNKKKTILLTIELQSN